MADIEIKSSLLNDSNFETTKKTLIAVSEVDRKENWRVKMMEYINSKAASDGDEFFYNMLPHVLFDFDDRETTAYTNEFTEIHFNAPGIIGNDIKHWDFTYAHECLHQLWDTYGVADKIKENGIEYNHQVLNIASDCVINDFLKEIRKKSMPDWVVTPEKLKDEFDIDFDRTKDTQYDLYIKLLEKVKSDKKAEDFVKDQTKFNGKLKPKSVNVQQGPDNDQDVLTPPPAPPATHSDDFKKGWNQAIQDVLDKKVDPLTYKFKLTEANSTDYDAGYEAAMNQIKEGLLNGLTITGGGKGPKPPQSDLAPIPWDMPPIYGGNGSDNSGDDDSDDQQNDAQDAQNSASDAQDAADKAQEVANQAKANNDSDAEKKQKAADDAKKAADKAKDEAKKAQDAQKKGDKDGAKKAAENAAKAAEDAKKAAEGAGVGKDDLQNSTGNSDAAKAQAQANTAKEFAKIAKNAAEAATKAKEKDANKRAEAAKKAQEAAEKAQKAADKAKAAEKAGDKKAAKEALDEAKKAANEAQNEAAQAGFKPFDDNDSKQKEQGQHSKAGKGHKQVQISEADHEKFRKHGKALIEKTKKSIGGPLNDFLKTCAAAAKLKPHGLEVKAKKAARGWNENLETSVIAFVKERVNQFKRKFKRTYRRIKRGTSEIRAGEILKPGKVIVDEQMIINVAFYIDRSGSMSGDREDNAWKATYVICDSLKDMFAREQCVEDVKFKLIAFDTEFDEVKFGNKPNSGGGTCSFHEILNYMNKNTKDYLITIVISDGDFSDLNNTGNYVEKYLKEYDGMIYMVFNQEQYTLKKIAEKFKDKLVYYKATPNFELT